jgi:hypothetical protein
MKPKEWLLAGAGMTQDFNKDGKVCTQEWRLAFHQDPMPNVDGAKIMVVEKIPGSITLGLEEFRRQWEIEFAQEYADSRGRASELETMKKRIETSLFDKEKK